MNRLEQKILKPRKVHKCIVCKNDISPKSTALRSKFTSEGIAENIYICMLCYQKCGKACLKCELLLEGKWCGLEQ